VVEDDQSMAALVTFLLDRQGFTTVLARDGREALVATDHMPAPHLVVLDLMLPYAGGVELITQIRSHPRWADVPVLVLSAHADEQSMVRALDAGADDYVSKPFRPEELMARVRTVLRGRRR
jgi:two-component system alkaline phosphatase synthesis response regulator PhoP